MRPDVRHRHRSQYQERRRLEALERQRAARRDLTDHVRHLTIANDVDREPQHVQPSNHSSPDSAPLQGPHLPCEAAHGRASHVGGSLRKFFAEQLMYPEWLTDVPADLGQNWLVLPRPEGQRCLVIAQRQTTIARTRSGSIFQTFASSLPGGSRSPGSSPDAFSILDTVYSPSTGTYHVMDLMAWNGYCMYDCSAEFRCFWMQSKLMEVDSPQANEPHFAPVPIYPCSPAGLQSAYSGPMPFQRDGILLLNRENHYHLGPSPLALLWKDAQCSRYYLDTDAGGAVPQWQHITLQYLESGHVATGDCPPIVLDAAASHLTHQNLGLVRTGKLLRFTVREGGIKMRDGELLGADLHFEGPANQRRGRADVASKIIFQHLARHQPISFEVLLENAITPEAVSSA